MLNTTDKIKAMIGAPMQKFQGRVELFNGSTLETVCTCHDYLSNFAVERIGAQGKLFGYGVCQKLDITLIDLERALNVTKAHNIKVAFGVDTDYMYPCPNFYIENVKRDETTNELNIIAYDVLYNANSYTVADLSLSAPYTIKSFMQACAALLGVPSVILNVSDSSFDTSYPNGANFDGSESLRTALDAIAEATQTIYYIDNAGRLAFKRFSIEGAPVYTIDKENYFTLKSGEARTLGAVCHATELGDNVIASADNGGITQYIRDNAFWEMREDIGALVENALENVRGLTIQQFICDEWGGNFLIEIGDKIALEAEDGSAIVTYLLDDTILFDGTLSQRTQWQHEEDKAESASNPTTLGEAINRTFARVDKLNNTIDLIASDTEYNKEQISSLQITTDSISAKVESVDNNVANINGEISSLRSEITQTESDLTIAIEQVKKQETEQVTTKTGFTFNEEGLTIDKSTSEISTKITEDGMKILKNNDTVLTADNIGVQATNLHATTYLIIGANSRFEDYNESRTGCFWIR